MSMDAQAGTSGINVPTKKKGTHLCGETRSNVTSNSLSCLLIWCCVAYLERPWFQGKSGFETRRHGRHRRPTREENGVKREKRPSSVSCAILHPWKEVDHTPPTDRPALGEDVSRHADDMFPPSTTEAPVLTLDDLPWELVDMTPRWLKDDPPAVAVGSLVCRSWATVLRPLAGRLT